MANAQQRNSSFKIWIEPATSSDLTKTYSTTRIAGYQAHLQACKMEGSMGRKSNRHDSAYTASFHNVIKKELVCLKKFRMREQTRKRIFE